MVLLLLTGAVRPLEGAATPRRLGSRRGTVTKWSQIKEDGDKLSGAGCNAESSITPVVRLDGAGTTHIFKKYLSLISNATFPDEKEANQTWNGTSEGTLKLAESRERHPAG